MILKNLRILKIYSYIILITILAVLCVFDNTRIFSFSNSNIFIYFIKPVICIFIILYICWLPKVSPECKLRHKKEILWWIIYSACIYSAVEFLGGVVDGFGKSPYSTGFIGILINIVFFSTIIISREMVRSYIVNGVTRKYKTFTLVGITILLTLFDVNLKVIFNLSSKIDILKFLSQSVLISLSINILMTFFVYIGGAKFSASYLLIKQGIEMLTPVLPDLAWITETFITVVCVSITIISIQYIHSKISKKIIVRENKESHPFGLVTSCILGIIIVWFTIGVFPVYPSVIATGSMKPVIYDGDIVIVEKLRNKELHLNDVIKYKSGKIDIVHRIVEIVDKDGVKMYKLKGDNNSKPDKELVSIDRISGRVVQVIPKVGWISLILKGRNVENHEVEF